jgi:pilus assembly protein FimV
MAKRAGVNKAARAAALACGGLCGLLTAAQVSALGLGDMDLQSFLNEPLRAEVELLDLRDVNAEDVRIRLASREDFARRGIDRSYFLTSIQFEIDVDDASGRGVIRLTTEDPVLEPYIDLVVEARWPTGRLLREYTVLVDPPTFRKETVTVSAADAVDRAEPETAPSRDSGGMEGAAATSRQESVSSGDTVRRLESDLPAGEMPARPFSAATADQPRAGSRYMVKRDETLWEIASDARPSGVPVQQAMLDIQRLNPEAFIDNNINRIKAGYIIYLPDAGDISSDDLAEALEEVRQQNQDFAAGRPTPGVTAAATLRVSAAPSPTPTAAAAAESGSASSARRSSDGSSDRASDRSGAMADSGAGRDSMPAGMGDAPAAADSMTDGMGAGDSGASAELAAQVNRMTERLDTLEEIVALKDEQIAALQQSLREAREAAAAPAAAAPAASAPAAPAPAAQRPAAPAARPAASSELPWLPIGGGVAVILALLALFLVRRRNKDVPGSELPQRGRADDDVFAGVKLKKEALADDQTASEAIAANAANAVDAAEGGEVELSLADPDAGMEPLQTAGGSRGYGERKHDDYIDEGAAGDALAEADIYIAYGRYLQAIELLDTAIEEEPDNSAYRLKLIELYVDMGEDDNAVAQLDMLRAGGDSRWNPRMTRARL